MMWLEVIAGGDRGREFPVPVNDFVRVGRSSTCNVYLYGPSVAKHHALLIPRGHYLECCRANQGYDTRLNGRPVAPPFTMLGGDELQLGEFVLRLRVGERPDAEPKAAADGGACRLSVTCRSLSGRCC